MADIETRHLVLRTNADFRDSYQVATLDGEGEPVGVDLDGWAMRVQFRRARDDGSVYLEASTANGRIVIDNDPNGLFGFDIDFAEIRGKLPPGDYVWDLLMAKEGTEAVPVEGTATVVRGITR